MSKAPEHVDVHGNELKIWSPETPGCGYSISDEGGWLDGSYDSREAAILGFRLSAWGNGTENGYSLLNELRDNVNRDKNHPRKISIKDFVGRFIPCDIEEG